MTPPRTVTMIAALTTMGCPVAARDTAWVDDTLYLTPANSYDLNVEIPHIDVAEGGALCFDWSDLPLPGGEEPAVDAVVLEQLSLRAECVAYGFAWEGGVSQAFVRAGGSISEPDGTRACVEDMSTSGELNITCEPETTWLLLLYAADELVAAALLDPCSGGSALDLAIDEPLTRPTDLLDADISSLEPLKTTAGSVPVLDWSGLNVDALDQELEPGSARSVFLAHVPGVTDKLRDDAFGMLDEADETWEAGAAWLDQADLRACKDRDGAHFDGFNTDGLWLLGLAADDCPPLSLTWVEVR